MPGVPTGRRWRCWRKRECPGPRSRTCSAFAICANAGGSILWTSGSTLLQRMVPDAVRGRVAAAEIGGFMLTLSASTLATGLLLDRGIPARALMAACGLIALVPLAYWAFAQRAFQVTGQAARG